MATVPEATTELHIHLEGSIEPELLCRFDPSLTLDEARRLYEFDSFAGFIDGFKAAVRRLQTPDHYKSAAQALFRNLAAQGIDYAEVIFSAGVVVWKQQSLNETWAALREATSAAPIQVHWIVDVVRQFPPEEALQVSRWASEFAKEGIVAFGIGGHETARPINDFAGAIRCAMEAGLQFIPHAGETSTAQNVLEVLPFGPARIGHGIRAVDDPELMARLRDEDIALEVCPTSNVRTAAASSYAAHPARRLFEAGVPITLNSDDPAIFRTNLRNEFHVARHQMGFTAEELNVIAENANRYRLR